MVRDEHTEAELARLLAEFGGEPVCRIAVRRYSPEWCAGYVTTIEVHEHDPVSLETIRDEVGGGRLGLKFMGKGGRYIAHRAVRICAEIHEVGHLAARSLPNPSREKPTIDDDSHDEIASLRDEVAALERRVDDLEDQVEAWEDRQRQAEALVQRALKIAESGEAEGKALVAIERMRESREAKDAAQLRSLLLIGGMILLAKMT